MYGLPKLEPNYPIKSALPNKGKQGKKRRLGGKGLYSLLRATKCLVTISELGIGRFKGSKSIKM